MITTPFIASRQYPVLIFGKYLFNIALVISLPPVEPPNLSAKPIVKPIIIPPTIAYKSLSGFSTSAIPGIAPNCMLRV